MSFIGDALMSWPPFHRPFKRKAGVEPDPPWPTSDGPQDGYQRSPGAAICWPKEVVVDKGSSISTAPLWPVGLSNVKVTYGSVSQVTVDGEPVEVGLAPPVDPKEAVGQYIQAIADSSGYTGARGDGNALIEQLAQVWGDSA